MVTSVTALDVVLELALLEAARRARELEGPQELVRDLEVGASSGDLVDEVLNRDDAVLAELLLNDAVVGDGDALAVDLGVTALVDKLTDRLQVRLTPGNVGSDQLEHLLGRVGELQEDTVVDLEQTQELHDLARLRGDVADTTQTHNKGNTGLGRHVEVTLRLGEAAKADLPDVERAAALIDADPTIVLTMRGVTLSSLEDRKRRAAQDLARENAEPGSRYFWAGRKLPELPRPKVAPMIEDSDIDLLHSAMQTVSFTNIDQLRAVSDIEDLYDALTRR